MGFHNRAWIHDNIAIPYIQDKLITYGLKGIPYGVEIHDKDLQRALMLLGRQDDLALQNRFKPDLYIVSQPENMRINPKVRPILCEIKSEFSTHNNFAIEFDSYCAAKLWDNGQKNVMYAFIKIEQVEEIALSAMACWFQDVYIDRVNIPRRFDFDNNLSELKQKYPNLTFVPMNHNSGSGTPYFVVRGDSKRLMDFDLFLQRTFELKQDIVSTASKEIIVQPALF